LSPKEPTDEYYYITLRHKGIVVVVAVVAVVAVVVVVVAMPHTLN